MLEWTFLQNQLFPSPDCLRRDGRDGSDHQVLRSDDILFHCGHGDKWFAGTNRVVLPPFPAVRVDHGA